jgi:hypothetical protein
VHTSNPTVAPGVEFLERQTNEDYEYLFRNCICPLASLTQDVRKRVIDMNEGIKTLHCQRVEKLECMKKQKEYEDKLSHKLN